MNKSELIKTISETTEISRNDVAAVIETMQNVIKDTVANGDKVSITGFATFDRKHVPAKKGVSKLGGTEKEWTTSAKNVVKVSLSKAYSNIE